MTKDSVAPHSRTIPMANKNDGRYEGQIIGGLFSSRQSADETIEALQELDISLEDIEEFVQLDEGQSKQAHLGILSDRGFSESQAVYYDKHIRDGKILVVVYDVADPAPIIDVFDEYEAGHNPASSRNLREDGAGIADVVEAGDKRGMLGAVVAEAVGVASGTLAGAVADGGPGVVAGPERRG